MTGIKNMDMSKVLVLKDEVAYQPGQVVSKTLAQNEHLSVTLFAFDKGEEISTHESGGDAFVTCLDGVGKITIDGVDYEPLLNAYKQYMVSDADIDSAGSIGSQKLEMIKMSLNE